MSLQTLNENLDIIQNLVIPFLEDDLDNIQKLDDEPNDVGGLTAAELKAEFDKSGNLIKAYLNGVLLPALSDTVAEAEVRAAAERERVANENIRIGNENARIENEDARVENETARVNAEKARADAESARKTAESQRATAESTRESQEATRKSNEVARQTAENTRTTQEATRQSRESTRQSNEQTRQSQEQSRKTSEAQRASAESQRQAAERARAEAEANRQNSFAQELNQAQEAKRLAERAAGEAESAAEGIGAYGKEVEAILFASGWSGSGPYTQTVSISGANEDSFGNVGLPESATKAQRDEARGSNLFVSDVGAGTITVTADGSKPTIDIPILVQFGQVISGSVGDVPSGGISITLDTTLSKSGYAADAKAVGDALAKFKGVPTVNTAAIGQTIRVSAVDDDGKPTEWEAVDMAKTELGKLIFDQAIEFVDGVYQYDFDLTESVRDFEQLTALIVREATEEEYQCSILMDGVILARYYGTNKKDVPMYELFHFFRVAENAATRIINLSSNKFGWTGAQASGLGAQFFEGTNLFENDTTGKFRFNFLQEKGGNVSIKIYKR